MDERTPDIQSSIEDIAQHIVETIIKPCLAVITEIMKQFPPELFDEPGKEARQRSREDLRRKREQSRGKNRHIQPTKGR